MNKREMNSEVMERYRRHQLIYLKKNAVFEITSEHENSLAIKSYVSDWINQALPCIYTRQLKQDNFIYLGLTALLNNQKHRVGLRVSLEAIQREMPLPLLSTVAEQLVEKMGENERDVVHVYGSFLFQYLSNKPFFDKNSDLDILLEYKNHSLLDIKKIKSRLEVFDRKIDGEIRFTHDNNANTMNVMDISINELLTHSPSLLVKTVTNIYLISRETLYAAYPCLCR